MSAVIEAVGALPNWYWVLLVGYAIGRLAHVTELKNEIWWKDRKRSRR